MKFFAFVCCALLGVSNVVLAAVEDDSCPEDYSPCTCNVESGYYAIQCREEASFKEIRNVFARIQNSDYYNFELSFSKEDLGTLPADLLSGKQASEIKINCPTPDHKLKINRDAFKDSKSKEFGTFTISGCDLSELDFAFIEGFDELSALQFTSCTNIHQSGFHLFPKLKKMEILGFESCEGLDEETMQFPRLDHGLYALALSSCNLDDDSIGRILDWALFEFEDVSPSGKVSGNETLTILTINKNRLTRIPDQIEMFASLEEIYLSGNLAPLAIAKGSLSFGTPVSYVDLGSSQVTSIEEGAFSGDFTKTSLVLKSNSNMTRFDESVFRPILEDMTKDDATGIINLTESRIDCETDHCHLAWLVTPNKKYREPLVNGKCIDGTHLDELEPSMFSEC